MLQKGLLNIRAKMAVDTPCKNVRPPHWAPLAPPPPLPSLSPPRAPRRMSPTARMLSDHVLITDARAQSPTSSCRVDTVVSRPPYKLF